MQKHQLIKLAMFNICFALLEIILFSRGMVNLGAKLVPALLTVLLSAGVFFGVNYWILNSSGGGKRYKIDKIKSVQDYRDALSSWESKGNPFNAEVQEGVHQLDLFKQKETALKALLGEQAKDPANPFMSVSEDVRECLLSNMRKLLNRMTILDPMDSSKFPTHTEFIHHVLGQNKQLLSQYDNLIIEISQIGDSSELENLHLENITEALRELRDEHPTAGEYGAAVMQQRLGDE